MSDIFLYWDGVCIGMFYVYVFGLYVEVYVCLGWVWGVLYLLYLYVVLDMFIIG